VVFGRSIAECGCTVPEYYGLTDEQLDFTINYDIKYRMGGAAEDDDDE